MLEIIKPGALTTVQDRGRLGFQRYGVPVSGAMDHFAFRVANLLVGNHQDSACLEITFFGPDIRVLEDSVIAVTGAAFPLTLNGKPVRLWQSLEVPKGAIVSFGTARSGCRAYLALAGGIDNIPKVLGSQSTYIRKGALGEGEIRPLTKNDTIGRAPNPKTPYRQRTLPPEFIPQYPEAITLRVIMGPQNDYFTAEGIKTFLSARYQVTQNADRMGYRLQGPAITRSKDAEMLSDGIPLGAVQVPGDGMPIVLMADRPTTGGYPKIATVITVDTYKLAQARPGNKIRFLAVTLEQGIQELKKLEDTIKQIEYLLK